MSIFCNNFLKPVCGGNDKVKMPEKKKEETKKEGPLYVSPFSLPLKIFILLTIPLLFLHEGRADEPIFHPPGPPQGTPISPTNSTGKSAAETGGEKLTAAAEEKDSKNETLSASIISEDSTNPVDPYSSVQDIVDLRPPVIRPKHGLILLLLALGILPLLLWIFWRRNLKRPPTTLPLSPYERALQTIESSREWIHESHPKRFAILVSDAVRTYLENTFLIRAIESTTEELLHDIGQRDPFDDSFRSQLKEFLEKNDGIKFTKYAPPIDQREFLYTMAKELIKWADKIRMEQALKTTAETS
jgi:hypothetical protein